MKQSLNSSTDPISYNTMLQECKMGMLKFAATSVGILLTWFLTFVAALKVMVAAGEDGLS